LKHFKVQYNSKQTDIVSKQNKNKTKQNKNFLKQKQNMFRNIVSKQNKTCFEKIQKLF